MKKQLSILILLFFVLISCNRDNISKNENNKNIYNKELTNDSSLIKFNGAQPKMGFVPDSNIAKDIAKLILVPIYGKEILEEQYFEVKLIDNNIWEIEGKNKDYQPGQKGGGAIVKISKKDGRILFVSHGK